MSRISNGKEFIEHEIAGIVTDMKNPTCRKCNECCTITAMITDSEYENIERYLSGNTEGKKVYERAHMRIQKYRDRGIIYMVCPFSNDNYRCDIYFIRPKVCREFHCSESLNKLDKDAVIKEHTKVIADLFYNRG